MFSIKDEVATKWTNFNGFFPQRLPNVLVS